MKTRMLRWLARVALSLVAIAAWGTGATAQSLSGVYGGPKCPYKLTFRSKDVVYIQFLARGSVMSELPGQYKVDGDKVAVTAPNWGAVFTRKGYALEFVDRGQTMVCTKLSDAGRPIGGECDQFGPTVNAENQAPVGTMDAYARDYNTDNICFDTRPIPLTPTTEAKGGLAVRMYSTWRPDQAQGAIALPMPASASITPSPALLLLKVRRDGLTTEAMVLIGSNDSMFTDAAVNTARGLRWHPAQKHGTAVDAWVQWEFRAVAVGASGFISVNVTGPYPRSRTMVTIDSVFVGEIPVIKYQVRTGRHTIQVFAGSRHFMDTVQVDSGATVVKSYAAPPR